jgi:hypothetical protein
MPYLKYYALILYWLGFLYSVAVADPDDFFGI